MGVEASRPAAFSDELLRSLCATGVFERVEAPERLSAQPDLVARIEHGWEGTAAIPIFTVLILGVVPTIVDEVYGLAFSLRARGAAQPSVTIDTRWRGKIWLGLPAALLNLSPDRTSGEPLAHPRYIAHVRAAVLSRATEIEALRY